MRHCWNAENDEDIETLMVVINIACIQMHEAVVPRICLYVHIFHGTNTLRMEDEVR